MQLQRSCCAASRRLLRSAASQAAVHHAQQIGILQRRCHALLVVELLVDGRLRRVAAWGHRDVHLQRGQDEVQRGYAGYAS